MTREQRSNKYGKGRKRNLSVRAVRRNPPDLRRLGRAVLQLAIEQAAAEAAAEAAQKEQTKERRGA